MTLTGLTKVCKSLDQSQNWESIALDCKGAKLLRIRFLLILSSFGLIIAYGSLTTWQFRIPYVKCKLGEEHEWFWICRP